MSDLVDFLTARLADDEQVAAPFRNDFGDVRPWRCDEIGGAVRNGPSPLGGPDVVATASTHLAAEHIARHDPARVLAEVAAKRRTVRWLHHQPETGIRHGDEEYVSCVCGWDRVLQGVLDWDDEYNVHLAEQGVNEQMAETMLRLLAMPYSAHPDYQESWKH